MNVIIGNANRPSYGEVTIPLPIPRKEYDHSLGLLQQMEIGDTLDDDCWVIGIENGPPFLQRLQGIHNNRNDSYWPLLLQMPHALNAGVDVNGFAPVTFNELVENNRIFKESEE